MLKELPCLLSKKKKKAPMSQRQYYFNLQMDKLLMSNKKLQCAMEQAKVKK